MVLSRIWEIDSRSTGILCLLAIARTKRCSIELARSKDMTELVNMILSIMERGYKLYRWFCGSARRIVRDWRHCFIARIADGVLVVC